MTSLEDTRRCSVNHSFFSEIDSEEKAYWLGFIVADGCLSGTKLIINLRIEDFEHLELLKKNLESSHKVALSEKRKICRIQIRSPKISSDLRRLGVCERKTGSEKTPNIRADLLKHFYRGLFDGDGCICITRSVRRKPIGSVGLVSASEEVLEEFSRWAHESAGFSKKTLVKKIKNKNCSMLCFGGSVRAATVAHALYGGSTVFLRRKMDLYNRLCNVASMNGRFSVDPNAS